MKLHVSMYVYIMDIFNLSYSTKSLWSDFSKKQFNLFKTDDEFVNLGPGDCIIWDGRDEYSVIVDVIGDDSDEGPRGFTYLPWRKEGRWASRAFSFRGDPRLVICYPCGNVHYGLHIPLHTIRKDEVPILNREVVHSYLYKNCITPLRFEIKKYCSFSDLTCTTINEHTYHAKNDEVCIEICIFRMASDILKKYYLVTIDKISGDETDYQDFILDFDLTEYPLPYPLP